MQHSAILPNAPTNIANQANPLNVNLDAASLMEMIHTVVKEIVPSTNQNTNNTNINTVKPRLFIQLGAH